MAGRILSAQLAITTIVRGAWQIFLKVSGPHFNNNNIIKKYLWKIKIVFVTCQDWREITSPQYITEGFVKTFARLYKLLHKK
jgi:hypothetical protein